MDIKEKRFEEDIETYMLSNGGYTKGSDATFDREKGIDLSKISLMFSMAWRGGRVVDCTALEMRHRCKPIGGPALAVTCSSVDLSR